MNGFGKNLTEKTINTKLYRKVTSKNFAKEGQLCFSTENSKKLIERGDLCIVLEKNDYIGDYDYQDADAGKNYGYDEFRISMNIDTIINNLFSIVCPDNMIDTDDYYNWNDAIETTYNISFNIISETEYKNRYNDSINFNF